MHFTTTIIGRATSNSVESPRLGYCSLALMDADRYSTSSCSAKRAVLYHFTTAEKVYQEHMISRILLINDLCRHFFKLIWTCNLSFHCIHVYSTQTAIAKLVPFYAARVSV